MKTSATLGENNCKLYLIKDLHPEYINSSENSVIRPKKKSMKKWEKGLNRHFVKYMHE